MARKLRIQYPGAHYHVMNRGDRREPIFKDDADRALFLETLRQACTKTGWHIHAYCLMKGSEMTNDVFAPSVRRVAH